jgi:hydrogenase expression/formation protein HypC
LGLPKTEGVGCNMCLAIPLRLVEISNLAGVGKVETGGMSKDVSLMLLPKEVKIGDYVLVHAGFAFQKLDEEAAVETLNLLREMAEAIEQEENP